MDAKSVRPLKVFIGCPGDMTAERDALLTLEKKLARHGCPVEFLIWPDVPPSAGRPQQVIFDRFPVKTWDIFIGILWMRFGSPAGEHDEKTGKPMTGTEEEFNAAYRAWKESGGHRPHVAIYRCEREGSIKGKGKQIAAVDEFFERLSADPDYHALAGKFQTTEEFKEQVERHLEEIVKKIHAAKKAGGAVAKKGAAQRKTVVDWGAAEARYRQHLIESHCIVKFHTAEARAPVEVELEKVFIRLMAAPRNVLGRADLLGGTDLDLFPEDLGEVYEADDARVIEDRTVERMAAPPKNERKFGDQAPNTGSWERVPTLAPERAFRYANDRFIAEIRKRGGWRNSAPSVPTSLSDLLRRQRHLALAGSPGSGKSTLLQYLVLTFASGQHRARLQLPEPRLPVLVRLRQFYRWIERKRHERKLDELHPAHFHQFLDQAWHDEKGAPELPCGFFQRLLSQPNALILLDGLDEVADPVQRRAIVSLVATALDGWSKARVILTSRPKAWENEGRSALGSRVGEARICDLDDGQIEEFVRHWYLAATLAARGDTPSARAHAESRAVDLIGAVKPERIRKLAATPLMLSILAMVHSRGVGLPQDRSQLYHECIEFMLGYWDELQGVDPDPELHDVARLDRATKRQILEPVAFWMHRLGSEQIEPEHDDLVREFASGFESVLNEPRPAAERHARAFLRLIVERGGLMQESEAGQFRFVHLTFQEYLTASAIAHGESPFAQVRPHVHGPWWREVVLLAGGELSRQRSYRVKADTTAWLLGIRDAESWSDEVLGRDLELAFRSFSEMASTGIDPAVSIDLATRVVERLISKDPTMQRENFRGMIKELPAGHAANAIMNVLCGKLSPRNPAVIVNLFDVASMLPKAAIPEPLVEALKIAQEHPHPGVRERAAFLYMLYGPPDRRKDAFETYHEAALTPLGSGIDEKTAVQLFDLKDSTLSQSLLTWCRTCLGNSNIYRRVTAAKLLTRYGTEDDRSLAVGQLCRDLANPAEEGRGLAVYALMDLRQLAEVPAAIACLSELLKGKPEPITVQIASAWTLLVEHRKDEVDWTQLVRMMDTTEAWLAPSLATFLLIRGDKAARKKARGFFNKLIASGEIQDVVHSAAMLLEYDSEADREGLASRLAEIAPRTEPCAFTDLTNCIAVLGAVSWRYQPLIEATIRLAESELHDAARRVQNLVSLLHSKPPNAAIPHPSTHEIAAKARQWLTRKDEPQLQAGGIAILRELSTFPEFHTRAVSTTPPKTKGKVPD